MNENKNIDNLHCKRCGAELASDSIFCEQCGKRVKPNKWLFIILAFAMLLVGGGLWYYMTHRSGKEPLPKPKPTYTISVKSSDETMGTVIGGGSYDTIITVTIEALANEGYQFVSWNDGYKERQRKVVTDHNQEYEAQFENKPETPVPPTPTIPKFLIRVESSDPNMGTVTGGGTFDSLAVVTIEAVAKDGYRFVSWSDGNNKAKRTIKVTANQEYLARFKSKESQQPVVELKEKKYWFGRYEGDLKNGIPDGNGTMFYDCQIQIAKYSSYNIFAEKGDYFVGNWKNGDIYIGNLYDKNGVIKYENIKAKPRTRPYDLEKDEYLK